MILFSPHDQIDIDAHSGHHHCKHDTSLLPHPQHALLQQYFSDDRIDDLLTCFHRSLFPLPPTLQQQCIEDGEVFYWSQQTSMLRKSLFMFLKGVSELAPQRILRYLTAFYEQFILTNSASVQELFGFLCMIEGSHPHLSKDLVHRFDVVVVAATMSLSRTGRSGVRSRNDGGDSLSPRVVPGH